MITVGSEAARFWGMSRREPLDIDVWVGSEFSNHKVKGLDAAIIPDHILSSVPVYYGIATKEALYTIKCSHLQWDIKWDKTKADILHMESKGCVLLPYLYKVLVKHWEKEHGDKSHLSLNKNKEAFFDDYVPYKYDHDYLHKLVSHPETPMYTKLITGDTVLLDRDKFKNLTLEEQVRLFREEITVIACERWLLLGTKINWHKAYNLALKKVITNLTKNWASDFIIHNLKLFVKPNYNYFKHILKTLTKEDYEMSDQAQKDVEELYNQYQAKFEDEAEAQSLPYFIYMLAEGDYYNEEDTWLKGLGYEHQMQEGGGEGEAEYCEAVFSINGKNYHCSYSYYSHNGHEYDYIADTLRYVSPQEKTVTVWG